MQTVELFKHNYAMNICNLKFQDFRRLIEYNFKRKKNIKSMFCQKCNVVKLPAFQD